MARHDHGERPRGGEELAGWYGELLEEQQASGLSVTDFAESLGMSGATLYKWRRRLAGQVTAVRGRCQKRSAPEGLIEVSLERSDPRSERPCFRVRLAGGHAVEIPNDFDGEVLQRLIAVLERC